MASRMPREGQSMKQGFPAHSMCTEALRVIRVPAGSVGNLLRYQGRLKMPGYIKIIFSKIIHYQTLIVR